MNESINEINKEKRQGMEWSFQKMQATLIGDREGGLWCQSFPWKHLVQET